MSDTHKFQRRLAAGECLFREGEAGNCAYVLEQGRMEVSTERDGTRVVLATVGEGALLGEMALINNQPRMATLTALEDTSLVMITPEYLADRMETADPMLRHILRVVLSRFREVVNSVHGGRRAGENEARDLSEDESPEHLDQRSALKRLQVEHDLELALERRELQLYYQPILRLSDKSVSGFEALIRWHRPGVGMVPPGQFIPVAEQSNLMRPIGYWIIETACRALKRMHAESRKLVADAKLPSMSINLSVRQFGDEKLFPIINNAIQTNELDPARVRLEITESMLFNSWDLALDLLNLCKQAGCRLAIDDFGTGYSSLAYLHRFPVDTLKIDRSFIRDMYENREAGIIVKAMADLAMSLGMECIAEGIEEQMQGESLAAMGLEHVQGFFYGKPMPEDEALAFLAQSLQADR